ncbi:MAG: hypothetical protein ACFB5Z_14055 [Elainellaceae cyanobacterium]
MTDSTLWLALSLGLVAVSLTAVLVVALPAVVELGRAARSAEKLFDTLNRELPPVLNAMQTTGQELSELTEEVGESVESAGRIVQQVDQGVQFVKQQAGQARRTSRSFAAGARAAWVALRDGGAAAPFPAAAPSAPPPAALKTTPLEPKLSNGAHTRPDQPELMPPPNKPSPAGHSKDGAVDAVSSSD